MIDTKLKRVLFILEQLHKRPNNTLDSYDEELQSEFGLSPKQIGRLLDEVANELDTIEITKTGKRKAYRLIKPVDLFVEAFENANEISWLFNMAHDADPEIFKKLESYTNLTRHVYQFKNTPFEDTETIEEKETFKRLKTAVEHREYRKIKFKGRDEPIDNLKCLKLIFMEGNWYIAYIDNDLLKFGRISFIERVDYANNMGSYQPSSVENQLQFLETIQNSMTLYGKEKKIARIRAVSFASKYFDEGMKPFLSSQKFVKKLENGSVEFTVAYTQPMEILPLIQSWLPNLIILEPVELKETYLKRLETAVNNHKST